MTWNLQSYATTVLNERICDILGGQNILWPSCIFSEGLGLPKPPSYLRPCLAATLKERWSADAARSCCFRSVQRQRMKPATTSTSKLRWMNMVWLMRLYSSIVQMNTTINAHCISTRTSHTRALFPRKLFKTNNNMEIIGSWQEYDCFKLAVNL